MKVDPATTPHRQTHDGTRLPLLLRRLPQQVRRRSGAAIWSASPPRRRRRRRKARSTPARCTPKSAQAGPGACPICGMALEPETATADDGAERRTADMTRRFWIGLALALPVVVLEMGGTSFGSRLLIAPRRRHWSQFALATPVVLWAGWPFFVRGWRSLRHAPSQHVHADRARAPASPSLQRRRHARAAAVSARRSASTDGGVAGLFRGGGGHHRAGAARPGAGTARARRDRRRHPRAARSRAEDRAPDRGRRQREEVPLDASPSATACGCGPGEKMPVDGERGRRPCAVDESMVTGESMPVAKAAGAQGHRRHAQPERQLRHARREGRRATRCWRKSCRWSPTAQRTPRADPAPGRPGGVGWFVPAGDRRRAAGLRGLVDLWAASRASPTRSSPRSAC